MARTLRNRKPRVVKRGKKAPGGILTPSAGSAVLTQETNEKEGEDVEMKIDVEETELVEGEETEESQTLLDIRREAAEALAREDDQEDAAPPSSQPRPVIQQSAEDDDAEESAKNNNDEEKEEDSVEGEFSYADLSENFSAQDGAETDGLDLEAFEYDPQDKEFLEELLAVAPEEEKALLRRLSVVNDVDALAEGTNTTKTTNAVMSVEAACDSALEYMKTQPIWNKPWGSNRGPIVKKFRRMVSEYASSIRSKDCGAVISTTYQNWRNDPILVEKWAKVEEEKRVAMEAAAQHRLEKATANKAKLWERGRERREEAAAKKAASARPPRTKVQAIADGEAKRERIAAELAIEEAAKSLDDAKTRALKKRKRTPEEDEHTDSVPASSAANPAQQIQGQSNNTAVEQKVKLVGAHDWYGAEGQEKMGQDSQPGKKRSRRAKNGPAVSAHFASSAVEAKGPSVLITTEDVVMEDASENASEVSAQVTNPTVQRRNSSLIGVTADDEDRPITFSGGGNAVERVLRTEETLQPVSIQPRVKTHQIEQSRSRVPVAIPTEQEKKLITEAKLRQQNIEEEQRIKKMAGIARAAVQAAKQTVQETVAENQFNMPAVKKLEKEAEALEAKAKELEEKNKPKTPRTKRRRNKNKLAVDSPVLPNVKVATPNPKVTTPNPRKEKKVADEKVRQEFLAARERDNNDPAIIAKRLADGLSAKGKKLRMRGQNKGPKSAPVVSAVSETTAAPATTTSEPASTAQQATDALATKLNASSEKPNDVPLVKKSRRGGRKQVTNVDAMEVSVSKDHHS